jgi:hypothetical protein
MPKALTVEQVLARIEIAVKAAGSAKAVAADWRVSEAYLSDVRAGTRLPGPSILSNLGLEADAPRYVTLTDDATVQS